MKISRWIRSPLRLKSSLALRLIALVISAVLLSAALIGGFMAERSRASLREQIISNNLTNADLVADDAARYVRSAQNNARELASRDTIVRAVVEGKPKRAEPELILFLKFN